MRSTKTQNVVQQLVSIFDLFGDPGTLVADNGPQFSGKGFRDFLAERDIEYLNSPSYHPQSNGLAERFVRMTKDFLQKSLIDRSTTQSTINGMINTFLFTYRNTVNAEGWSPAEKLFGFAPRQGTRKLNKMEVRRSSSTREDSAEAPPRRYDPQRGS